MMSSQCVFEKGKIQLENFIFCRLCLNITSYANSQEIEVAREVLEVILPSLILEKGQKHVMCNTCRSKLFAAFNFKSKCLATDDIILSHFNSSKLSLVDLKELYLEMNGNIKLTDMLENHRICRLCLQLVTCRFVLLNEVDNDIIVSCIPQANISVTKDPVICRSCFDSICSHGDFIKNCLEVQKKYKSASINQQFCIKSEKTETEGDQDKNTSLHNLKEEAILNEGMYNSEDVRETKFEHVLDPFCTKNGFVQNCFEAQEKYKSVSVLPHIKSEEIEVKVKNEHYVEKTYKNIDKQFCFKSEKMELEDQDNDTFLHNLKEEAIENEWKISSEDDKKTIYEDVFDLFCTQGGCVKNYLEVEAKNSTADKPSYIKCEEVEIKVENGHDEQKYKNIYMQPCVKFEEIKIKSEGGDDGSFLHSLDEETRENRQMQILEGTGATKYEYMLKCSSKVQLNKWETVSTKSLDKNRCKRKLEGSLKHKSVSKMKRSSEVQMYKCDTCDYETKRKGDLKSHQLLHKDPSEIQMYKCDTCSYETKFKSNLRGHHLIHKDPSEIRMYKCDTCDLETKYKSHLKSHQLVHKDPCEIQMYKCDVCAYESKYKGYLKDHQLIHIDSPEIRKYRCNSCDFETKRKISLKRHQLTHKDTSKNYQLTHANSSTTGM